MYVRDKNEMSVMWSITWPCSSEAQTPNFNHSFNHLVEIHLLLEYEIEERIQLEAYNSLIVLICWHYASQVLSRVLAG